MADEFWKEADIIKHVKKLSPQTSEAKIRAHLKAYIDIIKRLASEEYTLTIGLANLGNIYAKKDRIKSTALTARSSKKRKIYQAKLDKIVATERSQKRKVLHSKKFWLRNWIEARGLSWEEIENRQNEKNGSKKYN